MSPTLISGATAVCTATVSLLHSIEWIDNDWRAHSPSTAFRSLSTRPCLCYPHCGGSFQPPTRREQPAGSSGGPDAAPVARRAGRAGRCPRRSEEHTSELQSRLHLVCRLLLEKKKKN